MINGKLHISVYRPFLKEGSIIFTKLKYISDKMIGGTHDTKC